MNKLADRKPVTEIPFDISLLSGCFRNTEQALAARKEAKKNTCLSKGKTNRARQL